MKHYSHLSEVERHQISALLKKHCSITEIANILGRNKSTISREIIRNKGDRGYRPKQAYRLSIERKRINSTKFTKFARAFVSHLIREKYSPEQIHGRLNLMGWEDVPSIEWIYQFVYADKRNGGDLHKSLRCQKQRRKRYGSGQSRRGKIPNRVDIDDRPELIEKRARLGDFEGDTVVGKRHKGVLVTLVDRVSREVKIKPLPRKLAASVSQACIDKLKGEHAHTITFDNGLEFAQHEDINKALDVDIYFAKPYHSWERGTNENTNGLIRQYFPKSMRLDQLSDEAVQTVENALNNRPRKTLGYLTPLEVKSRNYRVALQS